MRTVSAQLDRLHGADAAVITFAPVASLAAYRNHLELPFPVLTDPTRALYRRFGLGRGSFRDIYGVGTLRMYARLLRNGRRLSRPTQATQDTRQLGGDFAIDGDGRLLAAFRPSSPDSRPTLDQLIEAFAPR